MSIHACNISREGKEGFIRFARCVVRSKLTRPRPSGPRVTGLSIVRSSDFYVLFQFLVRRETSVPEIPAVMVGIEIRRFPANLTAVILDGSIPFIHSFHGGPCDDVSPNCGYAIELFAVIRMMTFFIQ